MIGVMLRTSFPSFKGFVGGLLLYALKTPSFKPIQYAESCDIAIGVHKVLNYLLFECVSLCIG